MNGPHDGNIDKCKSLHNCRKNKRHSYEMERKKLKQVTEEKDLGILIDDELKFNKQTSSYKNGEWCLRPVEKIIHTTQQNNTTSPV